MKLKKLHGSKVLDIYSANMNSKVSIPFSSQLVSAGFPSPADDFLDLSIDLNKELIEHPSSTFCARVKGDSMKDEGIDDGDLLVIDKSLEPENNKVAVCFIDGEFTVKRIKIEKDSCWLVPANKNYKPIKVTEANDFIVWGIVIHVIKSF